MPRLGSPPEVTPLPPLRRLRLVLHREPEPLALSARTAPSPTESALGPPVEFIAYAEDCLLSGYVRLGADRLTDLLDQHEELQLVDV